MRFASITLRPPTTPEHRRPHAMHINGFIHQHVHSMSTNIPTESKSEPDALPEPCTAACLSFAMCGRRPQFVHRVRRASWANLHTPRDRTAPGAGAHTISVTSGQLNNKVMSMLCHQHYSRHSHFRHGLLHLITLNQFFVSMHKHIPGSAGEKKRSPSSLAQLSSPHPPPPRRAVTSEAKMGVFLRRFR